MQTNLYNQNAEEIGKIELNDKIFGVPMNADLLSQIVNSQMANKRQTLAHAKTRSEVRGGGKKPWRQKGTGRARHGSIRSPIWKGGGATFGPTKDKNFKKKINRKMAQKALFVALSSKLKSSHLLFLDKIEVADHKTKNVATMIKNLSNILSGRMSNILVITSAADKNLKVAASNLKSVDVTEVRNLNTLEAVAHNYLIMTKDAAESIKASN